MSKNITKYLVFAVFSIFLLASCSTSVRFSSRSGGGSSAKTGTKQSSESRDSKQGSQADAYDAVTREAERYLGTPYCYGGDSEDCFDCSGFVRAVFFNLGFVLPRTAAEQYEASEKIDKNSLRIGDLVFFRNRTKINHVGIYVGGNQMIHSSSSNGVIRQSLDDGYLSKNLAGFGRILK